MLAQIYGFAKLVANSIDAIDTFDNMLSYPQLLLALLKNGIKMQVTI